LISRWQELILAPGSRLKRKGLKEGAMVAHIVRRLNSLCVGILIVFALAAPASATEQQYLQMSGAMKKLSPLVGTWHSEWRFYGKDGVTVLPGTYTISYVLDGAYLEWHAQRERKNDPSRNYSWVLLTTFNPESKRYEQTYFYNTWPNHVTETGVFDSTRQEYRTQAIVPREDGIHDEHVRSIVSLRDVNKIVYIHYSRYSYEKRERLQLVVTLTRLEPTPRSKASRQVSGSRQKRGTLIAQSPRSLAVACPRRVIA
jgi:hypothetical protein